MLTAAMSIAVSASMPSHYQCAGHPAKAAGAWFAARQQAKPFA
jgi:hypothetical protein